MSRATIMVGDARERLRDIATGSVDCVASSPPFLALRDYGGLKELEMGSEGSPAEFVDGLLGLTAELRRVLAPHGSIAIELGDTYSGSGGHGGDYNPGGLRDGQPKFAGSAAAARADTGGGPGGDGWPLAKSLAGIPAAYQLSLAYGYNVLERNGPDSPAGRWRVRNVIVWARPNPPVGSLGDKVRPATSYITVACVNGRRWFDLDAVRTAYKPVSDAASHPPAQRRGDQNGRRSGGVNPVPYTDGAGAPPLDWWEDDWEDEDPAGHATFVLSTHGYSGAHFATWPPKLAQRLVELLCPLRVCRTCGEPSRRLTEPTDAYAEQMGDSIRSANDNGAAVSKSRNKLQRTGMVSAQRTTTGWSDCGHDDWRPGVVLDPFAGSGTTLAVATGCGRDAIGIELYDENVDLIRERVGMFLDVDERPFSWPYWRYRFARSHREFVVGLDVPYIPDRFRAGYVRNDRSNRQPQHEGKVAQ